MIDTKHIGHRFPAFSAEIERGRLKFFAKAIGQSDLANSHVSPYDVSVARMMKRAGYTSGFFGKYHLGGPENNQAGNGGPGQLGWDYFHGWIAGLPGWRMLGITESPITGPAGNHEFLIVARYAG